MSDSEGSAKKATWMVTGAQGFLGANAGNFLHHRARTIGIARSGAPTQFQQSRTHDLADSSSLAADIELIKPDYLLHTAAIASHQLCEEHPERAVDINARATRIIAHACQRAGTKLLYISTDSVFSGAETSTRSAGNYAENDQPDPNSVYGATKLQGEINALQETDPLIIRTNFYGWSPSHTRSILEFFVNSLSHNEPVQGFSNITTTSLYVQTLMEYIWQLKDASGVFHVTSSDALTKLEFGTIVAHEFGLSSENITPTNALRTKDISLNTQKLAQYLGMPIETQREGIKLARDQQLWRRGVPS